MRLWMLIVLSLAMFMPIPAMVWLGQLEGTPAAYQCSDGFCSLSAPETFMPTMQQNPFYKAQKIEQENAQQRQQGEACEHGGYFQPIARLDNAPGKAGAGPRTGHVRPAARPSAAVGCYFQ